MDTDQLLAFARIAREGSFSRAARHLDITQPSISARIQALEREVGGPLFVRGGRKLALTERGASFLVYVQRALAVLNEGIEAARLSESGQRGHLTLATVQALAGGLLAEAIMAFHHTHPQVSFFARTAPSEQIVTMLYDGLVGLGLMNWPVYNPDLAELLRLRERLVLVAPAESALGRLRVARLQDTKKGDGLVLLVSWGTSARDAMMRIREQGSPLAELPLETVRHMLLRGLGVALVTRASMAEELRTGRVVEVEIEDLPPAYHESVLVCLKRNLPLHTLVRDFTAEIDRQARAVQAR
ncbi:MAG TPA: LysR family transcriptional regulator [Ktedonobacteraceae bacterium]|jgi:DNA-binding transcriptional LysR family regulator